MFRKNDREVIARDQAIEVSEETVGADGATRQWLNVKFPMRDGAGRWFVAGVGLEITERMRAQAEARQRLREIEDLYRNAPVGLCVLDRDLRWVRINERLAALNGIPAADHIGKRLPDLLPEVANTLRTEALPFRLVPSLFEHTYRSAKLAGFGEIRFNLAVNFELPSGLLLRGRYAVVAIERQPDQSDDIFHSVSRSPRSLSRRLILRPASTNASGPAVSENRRNP